VDDVVVVVAAPVVRPSTRQTFLFLLLSL
jgi:hypothetical protein